jgi:hypothetical protein
MAWHSLVLAVLALAIIGVAGLGFDAMKKKRRSWSDVLLFWVLCFAAVAFGLMAVLAFVVDVVVLYRVGNPGLFWDQVSEGLAAQFFDAGLSALCAWAAIRLHGGY